MAGKDIAADEVLGKHADWVEELKKTYTFTEDNALDIILQETGKVFAEVLEDAGVYKNNPEGKTAFHKFVDYVNQLRLGGLDRRNALIATGKTRMRPILMNTITTILGLIDMAVRKSAGPALMQPVAVVCIGGLTYATLMTLLVVPCIYEMMNKKELRTVSEADLEILDI